MGESGGSGKRLGRGEEGENCGEVVICERRIKKENLENTVAFQLKIRKELTS